MIVKGKGRLFFPALFEAKEFKGTRTFSGMFGVEPGSPEHKEIEKAILEVATAKFGKKAEAKITAMRPVPQQFPYRDGNAQSWEGAEGLMVLKGTKKEQSGKPLVLSNVRYSGDEYPQARGKFLRILDESGAVGVEITDEQGITKVVPVQVEEEITVPYSGCYVKFSVEFWAQDGDNAGIRCALRGVQFDRDGDAFSGGSKTRGDEFDDMAEGANAEVDI
jgi:hypothetical protein